MGEISITEHNHANLKESVNVIEYTYTVLSCAHVSGVM